MTSEYVRNPDLIVLQRRLFAPAYMGPGKWVIYDTRARRSHLAIRGGEDMQTKDIPRVLKYLVAADTGPGELPDNIVGQLVQSGLMVPRSEIGSNYSKDSFLAHFQDVVHDYPFVDYSSVEAFDFDRGLMAEYADESPMPSIWTSRCGRSLPLPEVSWADLEDCGRNEFSLKTLSAVLRFVFGQIGSFSVPGGERVRKANPSGGAKHPTEGWVEVGKAWQGIPPGVYAYDPQSHALVMQSGPVTGTVLTLSIRSRVERAMWRYRDPRSSRAILFDAGHVIENIMILLRQCGVDATLRPGSLLGTFDSGYCREPEVANMDISFDGVPSGKAEGGKGSNSGQKTLTSNEWRTLNPLTYFGLRDGGFMARSVHPTNQAVEITPTQFSILTHCIPSSRGEPSRPRDRHTGRDDILNAIPGSSVKDIEELEKNNLLMDWKSAKEIWSETRRWSEKGWYLPFLAWAESTCAAGGGHRASKESDNRESMSGFNGIIGPMRQRVTTRRFTGEEISKEKLDSVIANALTAKSHFVEPSLFLVPFKVTGLTPGAVHSWDVVNKNSFPIERVATADEIVHVTIGQGWVRNCAAMLWLISRVDVESPATYPNPHILLGRIAQRVALSATAEDLGVFQTPATLDGGLASLLGHENTPDIVSYTVAVGCRKQEKKTEE